MRRKRVFGASVIRCIHVLELTVTGLLTYIFWAVMAGDIISKEMGIIIIILVYLVLGAGVFIVERQIISPYQESRVLFRKFVQGEAYQDVLDQDYLIFEEQKAVLERFDHLLNKKNIISASTKQAELLALQNQINPHFLYNTLEAIRGDALCEGVEGIADTTEALSTFFRYTITETKNLVTLEDELDNVENYFKIQQYRFGEKLRMEVKLPSEGKMVLQRRLPKLTLQPIIENAIFHGLESKAEGGTVSIQVETTDKKLLLSIKDDGTGMDEQRVEELNGRLEHISVSSVSENKRGSIALANVCRRIKLLFGEEYGVHIYSIQGIGTDVRVTIPLVEEQG